MSISELILAIMILKFVKEILPNKSLVVQRELPPLCDNSSTKTNKHMKYQCLVKHRNG